MSAYTLDYTYTAPSALIDGADSRALSLATSGRSEERRVGKERGKREGGGR